MGAISTFHTDTVCLFIGSILFKISQKKAIVVIVVTVKLLSIKADHSALLFKRVLYICGRIVNSIGAIWYFQGARACYAPKIQQNTLYTVILPSIP